MAVIDADFDGQRFLVRVRLPDATIVRLLADTGGGYVVDPTRVVSLPKLDLGDGNEGVRLPIDPPMPAGRDIAVLHPAHHGADGIVNAWWFTGRTWSFDYRTGKLQTLDAQLSTGAPLGFARTTNGDLGSAFPRVQVRIEDQSIDLLLDTGATIELSAFGLAALGPPRIRASSFIVESQFDRWRTEHPDWVVIEGASTIGNSPLIQVPQLTFADTTVGPVWFERRPDRAFHQRMSQWMDQRIHGALGATAYANRELVVDYTNALASLT